ncbi:MAG TPA: PAS domain S-box protein [Dongiaceae bacterium]|jgi:PAS domain S-box-containing protein|nr:PAS domain S-box protein [Dongiaceae bacterium]
MSGRTKAIGANTQQPPDLAAPATAKAIANPSEPDFRKVVEALPAAVYVVDADGRITYYNQAAAALWGYRPPLGDSQWCGSWRLYRPDGTPLPHDQCPMAEAIKQGRAITGIEAVAERPDGSRVRFMPFPTPLRDADGTLVGAVNMLVDVTERRQVEQDARHLAAIIENSDDAIISKNLDGIIMSWNSGAERLFGYTAEEIIGRPVTILMPPERVDEEPGILARIRRGERIEHYDTVRRHKDGSPIDISLTVSPIKDAEGRIVGASKIARDITERKAAEQRQQLLVGEIKHRIKNILATVQAIARQTLQGTPEEEREAFIARLMALANAQDLLTLERWNRAAVHDVVERALRPFEAKHSARFLTKGPQDVWVDAQRASLLTMALHELATNAVKYGALSNGYGIVNLVWEVAGEEDAQSVRLTWRELGGPPVVPPERKGFGSFLIERALQGGSGTAKMEFNPNGLICSLEVSL